MKRTLFALIASLIVCGAASAQRLPGGAGPSHYSLTFAINFSNNTFEGDETIDVKLAKPSTAITLNAVEIDFHDVTINAGSKTQTGTVAMDAKKEMATLTFPQPVPAGPAAIHIKYTGRLNDKLRGLYLSTYKGRKYAVTQMEATDARVAFPSFDEPIYKAVFDVTAIVDKGDTAISNGKIISDTPGPGENKHTIKFSPSSRMSSYLVALTVGDWKCTSDEQDGIPLRICTVPGKEDLTHYAMEATKAILHYYDNYYAIKYPYGKLDQIAVPDFQAGAMENAGAIVYRETALLIDDKTASEGAKRGVTGVIAHEMAHQWFGDLVTAAWWDDIWLNEGFATWMTPHPLNAWKPEWMVSQDVVLNTSESLGVDATKNTRPIHQIADTRAEIQELFDGIAYGKTASVLHMLEQYLGPETFQAGVNLYLKEHQYANATAADFWGAMARSSGKPVDQIMPTFVLQAGEPYVSVQAKCSGGKTTLAVSQKRFFSGKEAFNEPNDQVWQIPLCAKGVGANAGASQQCFLINKREQEVSMDGCAPFMFPDAGAAGYYRFNYDPTALHQIGDAVETGLTPEERIALLSNEWALVQADQHKVGDYLALGGQLKNTPGHAVLGEFSRQLQTVNQFIVNDSDRTEFQSWVRKTFSPMMQAAGYEGRSGDTPEDKQRRATLFLMLGNIGNDPEVIQHAQTMVQQYMKDSSAVDGTLAGPVVNVAARHGDAALYAQFKAHLKDAKSPEMFYRFFYALAQFQKPELLQETLDWSLTPDVRSQDLRIIGAVTGNPAGENMGWDFVRQHVSDISKKTGGGLGGVGTILGVTQRFCDAQKSVQVTQFFKEHPFPGTERNQRQSVETINNCVALRDQQQANLATWLNQVGSNSAGQP